MEAAEGSEGSGAPNRLTAVVKDTALAVALVPALLVLAGWSYVTSYQKRFGMIDAIALPDTVSLMVQGLYLMLLPAVFFLALYFMAWGKSCTVRKALVQPPALEEIPLLMWVATSCWLAGATDLVHFWSQINLLQSPWRWHILLLGGFVILSGIMHVSHPRHPVARALFGNTVSGTLMLVLLTLVGLALFASEEGTVRAAEEISGCAEAPVVQLQSRLLDISPGVTWHLVAHGEGHLFVRHMGWDLDNDTSQPLQPLAAVRSISESEVEAVRYYILPPWKAC